MGQVGERICQFSYKTWIRTRFAGRTCYATETAAGAHLGQQDMAGELFILRAAIEWPRPLLQSQFKNRCLNSALQAGR